MPDSAQKPRKLRKKVSRAQCSAGSCTVVVLLLNQMQPLHLHVASNLSQAAAAEEAEGGAPAKRRRKQEGDKPKKKVGRSASCVVACML